MRRTFVVVAGLEPDTIVQLASLFIEYREEELIPLKRIWCPNGYTEEYVSRLYQRVADELEKRLPRSRETLFRDVSLIVLYCDRSGTDDRNLLAKFGVEALIAPLRSSYTEHMRTSNERGYSLNALYAEIKRTLKNTRAMLSVIHEEITNRDTRTCLLLPPKSFGNGFREVCKFVHTAVRSGTTPEDFRTRIKQFASTLPIEERKYFVGNRGLVFKCPAKAAARHALAPLWGQDSHNAACVIRGRLRFGAPFDPRFHYDCEISRNVTRVFPGCHARQTVDKKRRYVNIAPNDNIR